MGYSRTTKAGILASGSFLTATAGMMSAAVLSRVLTKADLGTYRQVLLAYSFAAPLLMLGLPQALYYFLPGERERSRGVLAENLILLVAMGAVFAVFLATCGNWLLAWQFKNFKLAGPLLLLAPYPLFMLPASSADACLMARDRVKQLAIYNTLSRTLMVVFVVAACVLWRTPEAAVIGTVAWSALAGVVALKLMAASCGEGSWRPHRSGILAQVKYSVPLGLAGMLGMISMQIDKMVVSSMCTVEDFAVYSNGAVELPLINVITGSVTAVLLSEMALLCKSGNHAEALDLWKRSAIKCSLIMFPAACVLLALAPEFVTVLYSAEYRESALPFRLYLLMLPVRIVFYGAALQAAGRSSVILVRTAIGLALNIALCLLLVRLMGYIGAVVASLITLYTFQVPFCLTVIGKAYGVKLRRTLPFGTLAKVMGASILACLVLVPKFVLPWGDTWLSNAARLAIFGPLYGIALLWVLSATKLLDVKELVRMARAAVRTHVLKVPAEAQ